jgi:hypothetical protein
LRTSKSNRCESRIDGVAAILKASTEANIAIF